jgi:hypothetical protein
MSNAQANTASPFYVQPPLTSTGPAKTLRPAVGKGQGAPKGKRRQTGDRFRTLNTFLDASMAVLTPAERDAWLLLWRDTKPDGTARTSQADLARRAGKSDRAIRAALRALQSKGLLTVVWQGGFRKGMTIYRVHPLARDAPHP